MLSLKFVLTFLFIYNITLSNSIKESYSEITSKIISSVSKDSTAYKRLAYICDTFGPRLSGSRNLENSIDWILNKMEEDDLENVRGERVKVPTWIRGKESATILKPFKRNLSMLGLGGSIATPRGGLLLK